MATKFASPVSLVVNAVETSWIPYKFHIHAEDPDPKAFFRSALVYFAAGITYLWLGAAIWGPELLRVLMPPEYAPAAAIIWATTLIPAMQGAYYMAGTGFELQSKTRAMPIVSVLGLVTIVVSSFLLIEPLGALGAALATCLAWLVMSVTIYVLSQRGFPIDYDWATIGSFLALAATGVLAGYAAHEQPQTVRLVLITLLSLAYPLLCVLILLRSREERGRMQHLIAKVRGI
jgi:O-antigen/teichoic acid export membrane protein